MEKVTVKLQSYSGEEAVLGGDDEIVPSTTQKQGILFIEARVREDVEEEVDTATVQRHLEKQLSRPNQIFTVCTDLILKEYGKLTLPRPHKTVCVSMLTILDARLLLGPLYDRTRDLQSLKVVEYSGPASEIQSYCSDDVHIKVQVYQLYCTGRSTEEHDGLPQADVTPLPHVKFEGQWDDLFFEKDIKGDLIWMMTNILRFSQASGREPGDTNPLILLYGPPGTGKTTLCQGLAQKISIRLNMFYKRTRLVQIKAAALLSKYYSESAKQVDKIFTSLQQMCEEDPEEFICVLIDEVETIAISRQASVHGESQESLRATNAFLTGLDRTKRYPNIVFLCTSNMLSSLDAAFIDRCGLTVAVDLPSLASQYAILRGRIHRLISRGIVFSEAVLPSYRDAEVERNVDPELPSSKLLHILKLINMIPTISDHPEGRISGRSLTQLPEQALLRYLRGEDCELEMALNLIERYVKAGQTCGKDTEIGEEVEEPPDEICKGIDEILNTGQNTMHQVELSGRKRKASIASAEDQTIDHALEALVQCCKVMEELTAGLRRREESSRPEPA